MTGVQIQRILGFEEDEDEDEDKDVDVDDIV